MARVVQKFGGSSVADAESIKRVARRISAAKRAGNEVVIVISAMGDTTDELMDLALQVSPQPHPRELDMLLTTGERQSAALLAMALSDLGVKALSYTGSQAGVITTGTHGDARITKITPGRIQESLADDHVVIVAGFQGVSQDTKDITTLGRGASDTTAVALAAALDAAYCEIYSDVDGVFTADPRIVKGARQIAEISYEEMLEMAANGAKILHLRCVEYARRENVPVHVRSSFSDKPGTWVTDASKLSPAARLNRAPNPNPASNPDSAPQLKTDTDEEGQPMEQTIISGVAHDRSEAKLTVVGVSDRVGQAARIFDVVAKAGINVDMIVQNVSHVGSNRTDVSFTLPSPDGRKAVDALRSAQTEIDFEDVLFDDGIGKVSIVGVGMRSNPGVTARFFSALADEGINIQMISTSEIRISVVVPAERVDDAVRAAHTAFGLDADGEAVVYAGTGR